MVIKYRKKGKIKNDRMPDDCIPTILRKEGFDIIDMTGVPVISMSASKRGREKLDALLEKTKRQITIIYAYINKTMWGDTGGSQGIFFPENLDVRKIKWQRSEALEESIKLQEKELEIRCRASNIAQQMSTMVGGTIVAALCINGKMSFAIKEVTSYYGGSVYFTPETSDEEIIDSARREIFPLWKRCLAFMAEHPEEEKWWFQQQGESVWFKSQNFAINPYC